MADGHRQRWWHGGDAGDVRHRGLAHLVCAADGYRPSSPHRQHPRRRGPLALPLRTFAGDTRLALAAYHQGQASVQARGLLPETEHYVANSLSLRGRFTP